MTFNVKDERGELMLEDASAQEVFDFCHHVAYDDILHWSITPIYAEKQLARRSMLLSAWYSYQLWASSHDVVYSVKTPFGSTRTQ